MEPLSQERGSYFRAFRHPGKEFGTLDDELLVFPESQTDPLPELPQVRTSARARKAVDYMGAVRYGVNTTEPDTSGASSTMPQLSFLSNLVAAIGNFSIPGKNVETRVTFKPSLPSSETCVLIQAAIAVTAAPVTQNLSPQQGSSRAPVTQGRETE